MSSVGRGVMTRLGPGLVVAGIVSVTLGLGIQAHAFPIIGYCSDGGSCCIWGHDRTCPEGEYCLYSHRGGCSATWAVLCNSDSDCPSGEFCVISGICVSGENEGERCLPPPIGMCLDVGPMCRDDLDCPPGYPCILDGDPCPGGTCEVWSVCPDCSIATATFGTELEEKTDTLRAFRDKYLINNAPGGAFLSAYYKYSPPIAIFIAKREWLKAVVRILLLPVVGFVSLFV